MTVRIGYRTLLVVALVASLGVIAVSPRAGHPADLQESPFWGVPLTRFQMVTVLTAIEIACLLGGASLAWVAWQRRRRLGRTRQ